MSKNGWIVHLISVRKWWKFFCSISQKASVIFRLPVHEQASTGSKLPIFLGDFPMHSGAIPLRIFAAYLFMSTIHLSYVDSADLIVNGSFETGSLLGWTNTTQFSSTSYDDNATPADSGFFAQNDSEVTPLSGLSTILPNSGNFFALADSTTAGSNALIQNFTVPIVTTALTLSFSMFTYDWSGFGPSGTSLDYDYGQVGSNQHVRVDLLTADAPDFTTQGNYIVSNLFDGLLSQSETGPPLWDNFQFDIFPLIQPGSTYRLRFAAVDNLFVLNMGIDNVSLVAVPEPSSVILTTASAAAIALWRRMRPRCS